MMRITGNKRRVGLVVFAALLAIAFSVVTSVNHPAYAGVSGCGTQVNNVENGQYSPTFVFRGTTKVADLYINIDAMTNNTTGQWCEVRARADVVPVQGQSVYGPFKVELCFDTHGRTGCDNGTGLYEDIGPSEFTYNCPTVGYPNHCAIVGPWVSSSLCYFSNSDLDAATYPTTSTNTASQAYAWISNWC